MNSSIRALISWMAHISGQFKTGGAAAVAESACGQCRHLTALTSARLERALENPTIAVLGRLAKTVGADIRELFDPKPAARGPVAPLPKGRKPGR
jgi:hypothetical protein